MEDEVQAGVRHSREAAIEDAILADPGQLGFPGALGIRRCRVAEPCGSADVILIPVDGPTRLVIVEAKASSSRDAAARVAGQVLMYYSGALMLGAAGLEHLRTFATNHPERARSLTKISPKALTNGLTPGRVAWGAMYGGDRLKPSEVALFVALDGEPHRALAPTIEALRVHHGVPISMCIVQGGRVVQISP